MNRIFTILSPLLQAPPIGLFHTFSTWYFHSRFSPTLSGPVWSPSLTPQAMRLALTAVAAWDAHHSKIRWGKRWTTAALNSKYQLNYMNEPNCRSQIELKQHIKHNIFFASHVSQVAMEFTWIHHPSASFFAAPLPARSSSGDNVPSGWSRPTSRTTSRAKMGSRTPARWDGEPICDDLDGCL